MIDKDNLSPRLPLNAVAFVYAMDDLKAPLVEARVYINRLLVEERESPLFMNRAKLLGDINKLSHNINEGVSLALAPVDTVHEKRDTLLKRWTLHIMPRQVEQAALIKGMMALAVCFKVIKKIPEQIRATAHHSQNPALEEAAAQPLKRLEEQVEAARIAYEAFKQHRTWTETRGEPPTPGRG